MFDGKQVRIVVNLADEVVRLVQQYTTCAEVVGRGIQTDDKVPREQILAVGSYVYTLRGTTPEKAKAPEGELAPEPVAAANEDVAEVESSEDESSAEADPAD